MTAWVDYDRHARTCARDDLWGQVRRTVRGRPVGPDQVDLIVDTVLWQLELRPHDVLLDLACGNGALTARLHTACAGSVGVDVSPYLIEVARERFEDGAHRFIVGDAAAHVEITADRARFTKALCYGSLSYLDDDAVTRMLRGLHQRFPNVGRVLLGNLPDPDRVQDFHLDAPCPDLAEPRSAIGVWRSAATVAALAGPGWTVRATVMPAAFFAAHYRFDILLERAA